MTFEAMWRELAPLGRSRSSGGYFRQPFGSAERECHDWFVAECTARGLSIEHDGNGNTVAWWHPSGGPADAADAVLTGSHLDSVLDGGAYDGPLGVASALAAIDELRDRGFTPSRTIGVAAFAEEEGSRFGVACLGSRLAAGTIDPAAAAQLRDRDGVPLLRAMTAAGLTPDLGRAAWLDRVGCFVELHVEQGRGLVDHDAAVGVASGIWPHGRWRFDFGGEANHAGTTRMEDRRDPMLTYAMTALAANKQARLADERATFGRIEVEPNGTNAVPSRVTAWLDARGATDESLDELIATITRQSEERATRDGTTVSVTAESVSGAVTFDAKLAGLLVEVLAQRASTLPVLPTQAGHDAGILAGAGIPTAMLFVRNPTGISHSPDEHAEMADCLAGVEALADSLERLAS